MNRIFAFCCFVQSSLVIAMISACIIRVTVTVTVFQISYPTRTDSGSNIDSDEISREIRYCIIIYIDVASILIGYVALSVGVSTKIVILRTRGSTIPVLYDIIIFVGFGRFPVIRCLRQPVPYSALVRIVIKGNHVVQGLFDLCIIQHDGIVPMIAVLITSRIGIIWCSDPIIAATDPVLDSNHFFKRCSIIILAVIRNIVFIGTILVSNAINGNGVIKDIILYDIVFLGNIDVCTVFHRIIQIMPDRIRSKYRCLFQPIPR